MVFYPRIPAHLGISVHLCDVTHYRVVRDLRAVEHLRVTVYLCAPAHSCAVPDPRVVRHARFSEHLRVPAHVHAVHYRGGVRYPPTAVRVPMGSDASAAIAEVMLRWSRLTHVRLPVAGCYRTGRRRQACRFHEFLRAFHKSPLQSAGFFRSALVMLDSFIDSLRMLFEVSREPAFRASVIIIPRQRQSGQ